MGGTARCGALTLTARFEPTMYGLSVGSLGANVERRGPATYARTLGQSNDEVSRALSG